MVRCSPGQTCFLRLCTEKKSSIGCRRKGTVLKVTNFWFGRIGEKICKPAFVRNPNCVNSTLHQLQLENGKRLCDNETSCGFTAYFGEKDTCGNPLWLDPCPATPKYIDVNFTCISKEPHNYYGKWGSWSECSSTCGNAQRERQRKCLDPPFKACTPSMCKEKRLNDEEFDATFTETEICENNSPCPELSTSTMILASSMLSITSTATNDKIVSKNSVDSAELKYSMTSTPQISLKKSTRSLVVKSNALHSEFKASFSLVHSDRTFIKSINSTSHSKFITSTFILPPITKPTKKPPKEAIVVYGKVTINIIWKKFCENAKIFKEGISKILQNKTNDAINFARVILYNEENCKENSDTQTIAIFYVRKNSSNTPDKELTSIAVNELIKLVEKGKIGDLGGIFKEDNLIIKVEYVTKEEETPSRLWLIILVLALFFFTLLLFCIYRLCSKRRKSSQLFKVNSLEKRPLTPDIDRKHPSKKAEESKDNDDLPKEPGKDPARYTSAISVAVRPNKTNGKENPVYEVDERPNSSTKFQPVHVTLFNVNDPNDKIPSDKDEKDGTKKFVDGKQQETIPMEEINGHTYQ